ncbi:gene transfer agent-like protein [Nitrobacter sp. Nb-311A]|uniref:DUF3168 domain-containing protein n=1 Tax=Nitrobacter sp. Nb-311A TaxID=314253 RepID=UPI000068530D|nr:DUF3168 domain-containing protein [Nitrobacter sp. Nb-311A]EAQ34481.1 gene transfer agent-like protein [Nitrobacter sp. Nb-311A]
MTSPSLELQGVIVARLKADMALSTLIGGRVYDNVPEDAPFPYVNFARVDILQDDATCVTGYEINFGVDVWSRGVGFVEAEKIAHAVAKSMHNWDATLATYTVITLQHRQTRVFRDADGLTSHGVVEFVAIVTE